MGVLSDYIHATVLQEPASLNRRRGKQRRNRNVFINLLEERGTHTAAFVDVTLGLSFSVMHDKKRKKK